MTFYEELGVPPDAPLESIRDAYRSVARLLHPDVQTDPTLKESAESQMKRINHLYGILSDPERRRRYDQQLAEPVKRPIAMFVPPIATPEPFLSVHNGTLAWLAATALCAMFILFLTTRESSPSAAADSQLAPPTEVADDQPLPPSQKAQAPSNKPAPYLVPATPPRNSELAELRGKLLAATAERERLEQQVAARDAEHKSATPANFTPAPLVIQQPASDILIPAILPPTAAPPRWAGAWAYHPSRTGNKDKSLSPPEFIEADIVEDHGWIRGQYHARFKVVDAAISPDVDFHFEGKLSGPTTRLSWTGPAGASGEVQLHLLSDASLEIVWSATSLGNSMGLLSGTAVLNRKN